MSILSGFKKYKDYILTSSGYQLSSRWTKSDAVVMGDGTDDTNTLEKNLGSIQGITDSLTATSSNIALSTKGASDMYNEINSNLTAGGTPFRFGKDAEGNFGYIITDESGADSVVPFKKGISKFNHFEALAETISTTTKTVKGASVIFLIGTSSSPNLSIVNGEGWELVLWINNSDGNYRVQYAIYIGSGDCVVTLGSNSNVYQYCGLVTDGEII